ncbi:hypothetical protein CHS0354_013888 [Potamilus streckersoni]|nr:hypothetical protein CHS0354_013888 [Potamilus streckersoni]
MLSVVLINVTGVHSGGYTGEIKYGQVHREHITKELIIIDKPQIRKPDKTILGKPLNISCAVSGKLEGVNFGWKLNGTDFNSTGLINANSSLLIFERLWTVDNSSIFSCEVCQESSCCLISEAFSLDPYYGPYNVDLDVRENHIYLKENEHFTVKCSADCNPDCSFWWEGYINNDNEELVIRDFDSRKAGQYICYARNKETDIKKKSDPIFLHLEEDLPPEFLEIGSVIAVFLLVIVGFEIIKKKKCYRGKTLGSNTSYHPCAEQVNNEACEEFIRIEKQNRPLPILPMQENACRRAQRSHHPITYRRSKSLNKLDDCIKDIWNSAGQSLSLQMLTARCNNSNGSEDKLCCPRNEVWFSRKGTNTRISNIKVHLNDQKDKKESNADMCTNAESRGIHNSSNVRLDLETQDDLYYSIDETALLVYDYARAKEFESKVLKDLESSNTGNYDYDYAILPGP